MKYHAEPGFELGVAVREVRIVEGYERKIIIALVKPAKPSWSLKLSTFVSN